jgi:DNA-binding CsgD family transcriptional regulator
MDTRHEEWTRHYLEQDHVRFDAVVHEGFRTSAPFTWSEVYRRRNVDSREKRIQDERSAMGLKEALVVPIYEGRGFAGAVSVSCEEPPDLQSRQALTMGCVFLHHRLIAMQSETYGDDAGLTRREVECLNWAAEGKSDWEIGKILRISSKTVNYHIENVKRKFGVATRVQAIVVALRQGRLG